MSAKTILVLATGNEGKKAELIDLLKDHPVEIRTLKDFGPIPEIIEDGKTFDENAYKKASLTARYLGCACLADDSGLCVDALDGAPGVYSARYAGEDADDAKNIDRLLEELDGNPDRKAAFHCVLSIAVPTGPALTYEGRCDGEILEARKGEEGFGYDPVFYSPELGKTFAEASRGEKATVSHRGKALTEMLGEFDKVLKWLSQNLPKQERFECVRPQ